MRTLTVGVLPWSVVHIILSGLLVGFALPSHAQEVMERPRVGLVLSGGGTKAGAHIGVLRVLEEYHVAIDYIAGTSAGAIIGSLYAAGLSPDEIEEAIASIDWDDIVRDAPRRRDLPFRRKRDDLNYLVKSRPGYREGALRLPMGMVEGQKVSHFLRRHLARVDGIHDFDALPIPLRVVATDLDSGNAVVISSGDLALAVRASMSTPVLFSPVVVGDRRLIDGGVSNNLPVDVVRAMGAEIVIAVDISAPLLEGEEIDSVFTVTDQLTNFLTRKNAREQTASLSSDDILIQPELHGFGALEFEKTLASVEPGERSARKLKETLARVSMPGENYLARQRLLRPSASTKHGTIQFIDVKNGSSIGTAKIRHRLGFDVGDILDRERIEQGIANVYGIDVFERIDYRIVQRGTQTGVVIDAVPKPWGPNYLQFGLQLSEDFSSDANFNIGLAYLRTAVNERGGEWRVQLDLGERKGLVFNLYQPFTEENEYYFEVTAGVQRRNFRVFEGAAAVADLNVRGWDGEFAIGREFGRYAAASIGWSRFRGHADANVGLLDVGSGTVNVGEIFASAIYDNLDNANFPRDGRSATAAMVWGRGAVGADNNFEQLSGTLYGARSWGEYTLLGSIEGGTTLGEDAPLQSQFLLGGLGRLSGYPDYRFSGQHYALLNATAYKRLRRSLWFPLYAGFSVEFGGAWNDRSDIARDTLQLAGAVYAGADSFLGPLYLAWGLAEGGENTVYLYLGNPFTARGNRPLD